MKKLDNLDKYVIFCITVLLAYTIAELVISTYTGTHDALTQCVFAFFGAPELLGCVILKLSKNRRKAKEHDADM